MSVKKIYLNGRFLTQPITGVQRTAYELVRAIDDLIRSGELSNDKYSFILIYSGKIINPIKLAHIKLVKKGILKGNLWEQLELPFYTAGHLLVSMCTVSALVKKRQAVIIHDASPFVNPSFFSYKVRLWYKMAFKILGKTAQTIITVSEFSKNQLAEYAGINCEKIAVISNAADHILRYTEPDAAFIQKITSLKPYCLAVSSLGANKNFNGLSQAVKRINLKNYNMLIAGGVTSTLKYSAVETSVTYLGYVSNEELNFLYSNASLFIFPSFYEGFGIPPLEAMILGCPVLASNTSSLPEVLADSCAYCNPSNAENIAENINTLINNEDKLNSLREKGYQQAAKYTWHNSAIQLLNALNII